MVSGPSAPINRNALLSSIETIRREHRGPTRFLQARSGGHPSFPLGAAPVDPRSAREGPQHEAGLVLIDPDDTAIGVEPSQVRQGDHSAFCRLPTLVSQSAPDSRWGWGGAIGASTPPGADHRRSRPPSTRWRPLNTASRESPCSAIRGASYDLGVVMLFACYLRLWRRGTEDLIPRSNLPQLASWADVPNVQVGHVVCYRGGDEDDHWTRQLVIRPPRLPRRSTSCCVKASGSR